MKINMKKIIILLLIISNYFLFSDYLVFWTTTQELLNNSTNNNPNATNAQKANSILNENTNLARTQNEIQDKYGGANVDKKINDNINSTQQAIDAKIKSWADLNWDADYRILTTQLADFEAEKTAISTPRLPDNEVRALSSVSNWTDPAAADAAAATNSDWEVHEWPPVSSKTNELIADPEEASAWAVAPADWSAPQVWAVAPADWTLAATAWASAVETSTQNSEWQNTTCDSSDPESACDTAHWSSTSSSTSTPDWPTTVIVTEKIPWLDCWKNIWKSDSPEDRKYSCTIQPGFWSVMLMVKGLIKYATFLTAIIGVLMLIASGIHLSLSGIDSGAKGKAKEHFAKIIWWLVLLFLIGFVLNTVAPWIYQ